MCIMTDSLWPLSTFSCSMLITPVSGPAVVRQTKEAPSLSMNESTLTGGEEHTVALVVTGVVVIPEVVCLIFVTLQ